jgi:hypothetical protein
MMRVAPNSMMILRRVSTQAVAGGRPAGSVADSPEEHRVQIGASGPSVANRRAGPGTSTSSTMSSPSFCRFWMGKWAAPTTRRKIRARE